MFCLKIGSTHQYGIPLAGRQWQLLSLMLAHTLGLSLSGTIAIKQCVCNRFLLTNESAMWQRKKNTASPWVEPVIQQCAGQCTYYQTLGVV